MKILKYGCLTLFGLVPFTAAFAATMETQDIPEHLDTDFKRPKSPFLMLKADDIPGVRAKVQQEAWSRAALTDLLTKADGILAHPMVFPDKEGGWSHLYISPADGERLKFDPDKPFEHYSQDGKTFFKGKALDNAWITLAMMRTAEEQETLAAAWLLSGDKKYALAMKATFLDISTKYGKFRLHDKSMRFGEGVKPDFSSGLATSQTIDESNLLTSLAFSYDTLVGSGVISEAEQQQVKEGLWNPALKFEHRLMDELDPFGGNWAVWNACGAIVLGIEFGDKELLNEGLNGSKRGILGMLRRGYVNGDGFTGELSPGYHYYPFIGLTRMAAATRGVGINFYKIPRFKEMFDLPLKIMLPNLCMPRLNDGGQGQLATKEWASLYEQAGHWYGDADYLALLHDIYHSPAGVKRDSVQALLYGEPVLPDKSLNHSQSNLLPYSGAVVLRSPLNDWNVYLKNDLDSSGHRHPDALNLIVYANGDEVLPGTGSPLYGNASYLQWYSQSIAHNTVTLNTLSQRLSPKEKQLEFGLAQWGLGAAQSSTGDLQGKKIENETPAFLRRTVVVTPHAIVDLFRVNVDAQKAGKLKQPLTVNTVDWALHLNGTLTTKEAAVPSKDVLIPEERFNAAQGPKQYWPHQGYKLIGDLAALPSGKELQATLKQANGGKVAIWLAAAGANDKLYRANGLGLESSIEQHMPMLLQRRQANDTAFLSVYAPYQDQATVQSVHFLTPSTESNKAAVEVTHAQGRDLVLSLAQSGKLEIGGASLNGALGCSSELAKGKVLLLLVGQDWKDAKREISLENTGKLIAEFDASSVKLYNAADVAVKGTVKYSPDKAEKSFTVEAGKSIQLNW